MTNYIMRNMMISHNGSMLIFGLLMFCSCMVRAEKFVFTTLWTPQAEFAGYYVAKEKGFYKDAPEDALTEDEMKYANARGPLPEWPDISDAISLAFNKVLIGDAEPADAAKEAQDTIDSIVGK